MQSLSAGGKQGCDLSHAQQAGLGIQFQPALASTGTGQLSFSVQESDWDRSSHAQGSVLWTPYLKTLLLLKQSNLSVLTYSPLKMSSGLARQLSG